MENQSGLLKVWRTTNLRGNLDRQSSAPEDAAVVEFNILEKFADRARVGVNEEMQSSGQVQGVSAT